MMAKPRSTRPRRVDGLDRIGIAMTALMVSAPLVLGNLDRIGRYLIGG